MSSKANSSLWYLPLCIFSNVLVINNFPFCNAIGSNSMLATFSSFRGPSYSSLVQTSCTSFLIKTFVLCSIFISNFSLLRIPIFVTPALRIRILGIGLYYSASRNKEKSMAQKSDWDHKTPAGNRVVILEMCNENQDSLWSGHSFR